MEKKPKNQTTESDDEVFSEADVEAGFDRTESIDLSGLFTEDVTVSGSFDLTDFEVSSIGKLLNALPIPALLLDRSQTILFAGESCKKVSLKYKKVIGEKFSVLFPNPDDAEDARQMIENVILYRIPQVKESVLRIGRGRIWCRMYMRPLRMLMDRTVMVLVEDLTFEKRQLHLTKKHENALQKAYEDLEVRVEERTAELVRANLQLKKEIDEKKRVEEALRVSEERYRRLIEYSPDGVCVLVDGLLVFANAAACEIIGVPSQALKGRLLTDFLDHSRRDRIQERIEKARDSGEHTPLVEEKLLRPDQSYIDVELALTPLDFEGDRAVQVTIRDISYRRKAEDALQDRDEKLRLIADALPACISYIDTEGCFRFNNKTYEEWYGMPVDEITGRHVQDIMGAEQYESTRESIEAALRGEQVMYEIDAEFSEGKKRNLSIIHVPHFGPSGDIKGFISLTTDITERKRLEAMLVRNERLRAVSDLATGVAHNFNNLLQIVVGRAQLAALDMEMGEMDSLGNHIQQILDSARFGSETVKRLQSFARLRTDAKPSEAAVVDLAATVEQAVEMTRIWWQTIPEQNGIRINLISSPGKHCRVKGSENELFEVAVNLIRNAAEALKQDGEIRVETSRDEDDVCLVVSDTGEGIPKDMHGKIFEPFFTTKGYQRSGMGLAGAYGVVTSHGGTLTVTSLPDSGATFTIRLPAAEEAFIETETVTGRIAGLGLRILVIDDMEPVTTMLEEALKEYGQNVQTALSGPEGVQLFEEGTVDLVICDLGMPGMSGREVADRIREICETRGITKVPFILLTGWGGQSREITDLPGVGVDRVVEKPVDVARLMDVISELMQSGR